MFVKKTRIDLNRAVPSKHVWKNRLLETEDVRETPVIFASIERRVGRVFEKCSNVSKTVFKNASYYKHDSESVHGLPKCAIVQMSNSSKIHSDTCYPM